jgi:hypothetical protein
MLAAHEIQVNSQLTVFFNPHKQGLPVVIHSGGRRGLLLVEQGRVRTASAQDLCQDPRWQLAQRVASSEAMRKSLRLQEVLLFLTERVLRDASATIHEQDIGVSVFGRATDYNTGEDTIVRVHTFQLRKRLQLYFETEGLHEPVVIKIPKGSYGPVFVPRTSTDVPDVPASPLGVNQRFLVQSGLAAVVLLILGGSLGWYLHSAWEARGSGVADAFWDQMFDNGRSIDLVLGDASLSTLQGPLFLRRDISLREYQSRNLDQLLAAMEDPTRRTVARGLVGLFYVPLSDATAAHRLGMLAARHQTWLDIVFARDFSTQHLDSHNIILEGNRRSNPWMAFFEDRLNFQYRYDTANDFAYFQNVQPRQGEAQTYRVEWNTRGFSRVAYLPNLTGTGTVLMLSGTDIQSADAAARFVTSNEWIARIRERLALRPRAPLPYFEALLQTDLLMGAAPRFQLIAARVHSR